MKCEVFNDTIDLTPESIEDAAVLLRLTSNAKADNVSVVAYFPGSINPNGVQTARPPISASINFDTYKDKRTSVSNHMLHRK
jgi:hypothetical protein